MKKEKKKMLSIRVYPVTLQQIKSLSEFEVFRKLHMNKTNIVEAAVEFMFIKFCDQDPGLGDYLSGPDGAQASAPGSGAPW